MQTALNLDAQAGLRLPSISVEESIKALKCEIKEASLVISRFLQKNIAFFLQVPKNLLTFAHATKIMVIHSVMATVSPRLSAVGFFNALKYRFPSSGKKVSQYGGCMIRKEFDCPHWVAIVFVATVNAAATIFSRLLMQQRRCNMQSTINLDAVQVRPTGISVEESLQALKCEIKRLAHTKSETMSFLCEETVTYGEVAASFVGFVGIVAVMWISELIYGGGIM